MKTKRQKLIAILLVASLIAFIPLVSAAPSGTSETTVVEAAKSWLGVKSVHGGSNRSGIDCSHLVFEIYKQAGASDIVFQTVPNMKKNSNYVNTTSPTPGDIIFWKKDITKNNRTYWLVSHVGIYIGNEQFIDTSFDTKTVAIESVSGVYKDGMPYYAKWITDGDKTSTKEEPVIANNSGPNANNSGPKLPVAAFSVSPTSGKAPLEVAFTDSSTGATSWAWDFGDGSASTEQNPAHNYLSEGNYIVVLTANNESGSSSKTLNIVVQAERSQEGVQAEPVRGTQSQEKIVLLADFNADPAFGYAPLSVQFTDLSRNATAWNWDFGDGESSTDRNPAHTYYSAGNYNVNLMVSNGTEIASKISTINVMEESGSSDSSSGSSSSGDSSSGGGRHHSSGGGGGSGGSPEPAKNVRVKEISQIFIPNGKDVSFNFIKNETCIESITFRSTKTAGKTTTIVEELKNKSSLIPGLPEGIVYRSFNIWLGNGGYGNSKSIENASVNFKVNTSWVHENNINRSSVVLNKYDDRKEEWVKLPVKLTGEDYQFLHFTANVPGYSSFAITCAEDERNTMAAEPAKTATNGTAGSNASTVENKIPEENKNAPGFSIISGIVCLVFIFLHSKKR
ncbi:PGF-pre-PGF domain-containing protein [Methanosarcina sp. MSH10X1]|uniref:PGF-pre-PGF domain-containing protein n=1 Tax=Methanosarcina sp. MSH10X1 TaxID=2507075 RepID=UPI000FFCA6FD|nr:PGF-pre-PGF domain-containing protein [Methanosarcina sp. MSH10X1]RXA20795.1 PGF-pre-PGF domain-containing protein [Methanosarcina sp. MSH10X1]